MAGGPGQGQVVRVPALLPVVGKALFTVCKFQKGIICDGKYQAVNKVPGFVIFFQSSTSGSHCMHVGNVNKFQSTNEDALYF